MASAAVFLEHPSSLAHDTGAHPEQAARITALEGELSAREWLGYERVSSPAAERSSLYAVHAPDYVETIAEIADRGGGALDLDTVVSAGSFEAALHAAGGATALAEMLVGDQARIGFSAHRPPGHHALPRRGMGFCLFNNIAIAAQHAIDLLGLERVMILDWDVHHGNGTNDIFWQRDDVLFVSIHQSPLYPGTGAANEIGAGPGAGYTVNLPVPAGADDELFCSLVQHVAVPLAKEFAPQLLLISAGYDAHRDDPIGGCEVTETGFATMAAAMREICETLGIGVGCVLEGGYDLHALGRSVAATMHALGDQSPAREGAGEVAVAPLARAATERLARWWPGLEVAA
jgi:acetoin utilization deacetylase AcuC-like enzyme